ncbi:unnamed protein product [Rotaria sordida]|uniref:Uncharacterized protein n=1 Tax=Rotaria sordida TaxID=392033 RepID=A0A813TWF9_9BILA|nr:unnamed protein product [Rotaria sordida]CAF1032717.1 unnamed protein product [Rotaria sordida]
MSKFPGLELIHTHYQDVYKNDDWKYLINVFHYVMWEYNFLVVGENGPNDLSKCNLVHISMLVASFKQHIISLINVQPGAQHAQAQTLNSNTGDKGVGNSENHTDPTTKTRAL